MNWNTIFWLRHQILCKGVSRNFAPLLTFSESIKCKILNWLHGDKSYFIFWIYILSLFVWNFIVLSFIFILLFIDKSNKTDPKWYLVKDHFWPKYDFFFVKWSHVLVFCIFWVIGVFVLYYKWLFDLVIVIFFLKILVIWPKYVILEGTLGPY